MGQVAVSLNGRTYRFVCGDGEEARIEALAAYVGSKLEGLDQDFSRLGDDRMLVMVALLITDELFEARASLGAEPAGGTVQALKPRKGA
jgi:cell division protein ZapA